jgi:secreted PhoX family phosphatase
MKKPADLSGHFVDPDDRVNNVSSNRHFQDVLHAGLSRRSILRGAIGTAATALFGSMAVSACGGSDDPAPAPGANETLLGFTAIAKAIADQSTVPTGYTAKVIFACGDPLAAGVPAFRNDGTDTGYDRRSGDCHDGIQYYGLAADGSRDDDSSERALLAMNHEYVTPQVLHVAGPSPLPRPAGEVDIEVDCHGVSVVEVAKTAGTFAYVQDSPFNRRLTGLTNIVLSGPASGHPLLVTKYSPAGTRTRGSLNNCGNGKTPWGTLLTTEENWSGYFFRAAGDQNLRTASVNASFARYGRAVTDEAAAASRYGWETAGLDDKYARWDTSVTGVSADGSDDYRHEHFCQGYMVEMDPYDPASTIKKRTGMGRFAHENGAFGLPVEGEPVAVYMGCDSQNEYVYKWVSTAPWVASDATAPDRMATGDKYLDAGRLYAARYDADGTGTWLELSLDNPDIAGYADYTFESQAEVFINARIAADAAGATKMDRPEWVDVHPTTGEIYITMTNNSNRRLEPTGTQTTVDPANPRAYVDVTDGTRVQNGNVHGHIVRMSEDSATATSFQWDVFLFGAESSSEPTLINLSGLNDDQDFSSPDGLAFTRSTGICWIQTDDFAYRDLTNNGMLAALPGTVGDGGPVTLDYGSTTVTTPVGKKPEADTLKRFYLGPNECEVTGCCETPDGTVMFINIQHPGDSIDVTTLDDPDTYPSQWPSNEGYGAGQRPRSATVMITKNDGGRIGT